MSIRNISPVIFGVGSETLTAVEKDFFKNVNPLGFIIFSRNINNKKQLKILCKELREVTKREKVLILIDQEGGRVQRMTSPNWDIYPPAGVISNMRNKKQSSFNHGKILAHDLKEVGINTNCAPLLDLSLDDAHNIIGDRAFKGTAREIGELGKKQAEGLMNEGVLPVIKHIPGHGRARCDSHLDLPVVDEERNELENTDFLPFKINKDMPLAMTAHIIYSKIDNLNPASHSKIIIRDIIRDYIGFNGLLMCDDLSMNALKGSMSDRAKKCLDAGCDVVLHCNGNMKEMKEITSSLSEMPLETEKRLEKCEFFLKENKFKLDKNKEKEINDLKVSMKNELLKSNITKYL